MDNAKQQAAGVPAIIVMLKLHATTNLVGLEVNDIKIVWQASQCQWLPYMVLWQHRACINYRMSFVQCVGVSVQQFITPHPRI